MFSRIRHPLAAVTLVVLGLTAAISPAQQATRSPRDAAEQGLRWIGLLEPLFTGCHLSASLTGPFTELANLIAHNAESRGFATAAETARWRAEGAAEGGKRLAGMSQGAGLSNETCAAVVSELNAQRDSVLSTVKQLRDYEAQHPTGRH